MIKGKNTSVLLIAVILASFLAIFGFVVFYTTQVGEQSITYTPDDHDVYDPKHAPEGTLEFITRSYTSIPEDKLEIWFSFGVTDPDLDIREIKVTYQINGGAEQVVTNIKDIEPENNVYDNWGMSTFAEAPYNSVYGIHDPENDFYMLIHLRMWDNAGNYVREQLFVTPTSYGVP